MHYAFYETNSDTSRPLEFLLKFSDVFVILLFILSFATAEIICNMRIQQSRSAKWQSKTLSWNKVVITLKYLLKI